MFDLDFKGEKASDYGIKVAYRPNIPAPEKNFEIITIPGRDGSLIVSDNTYSDIQIEPEMNFIISPESWGVKFRQIKQWLQGSGKLKFSDDASVFYKCKNVNIGVVERRIKESGEFTPVFLCDPFTYIESGTLEYNAQDLKLNPYDISKPVYKITGEGVCTLTVNGNEMTANVGQNLTIDTDLMIAYREDGILQNTAVTGEYENMYLKAGENEINISNGFELKIIPNWRCL